MIEERKMLWKRISHLNAALDAHIVTHAVAPRCLAVCLSQQQHLPRELRDLIYGFVLGASELRVITRQLRSESPDRPKEHMSVWMTTDLEDACRLKDYRHLFNDNFADATTHREMATWWYQSTTFYFDRLESLRELLGTNCWGLDRDTKPPVKHVVVGLEIFCDYSSHWVSQQEDNDEKALNDVLNLAPSFDLRPGTHIKLVMKTDIELQYQTHFPKSCLGAIMKRARLVFPMLDVLLKDGHYVEVALSGVYDGYEVEMEILSVKVSGC